MSVVGPPPLPTFEALEEELAFVERVTWRRAPRPERALSHGEPSRPVLGLPLARWIPQDVHAVGDYACAIMTATGARSTDPRAQLASVVLAVSGIGVAATTDYRLGVAKLIPIEAHEVSDYAWGIAAIAAPFVLGYWMTAPRAALAHVMAGATTILSSLVTDYRAFTRRRR